MQIVYQGSYTKVEKPEVKKLSLLRTLGMAFTVLYLKIKPLGGPKNMTQVLLVCSSIKKM